MATGRGPATGSDEWGLLGRGRRCRRRAAGSPGRVGWSVERDPDDQILMAAEHLVDGVAHQPVAFGRPAGGVAGAGAFDGTGGEAGVTCGAMSGAGMRPSGSDESGTPPAGGPPSNKFGFQRATMPRALSEGREASAAKGAPAGAEAGNLPAAPNSLIAGR